MELVRTAQESKSPLQRLADRYAVWFTPLTLAVCAGPISSPATPPGCSPCWSSRRPARSFWRPRWRSSGGINRAARRGIIFRHGTALEQLGQVAVAVFDKTGTLTIGRPKVARVLATAGVHREGAAPARPAAWSRVRPSARPHPGAGERVERGIVLPAGKHITEAPGQGVSGEVEGRQVTVGGWSYVVRRHPAAEPALRGLLAQTPGAELRAYVAVDGRGAGLIEYADRLRPELAGFIPQLRRLGVSRIVLLSGDDQANATAVAGAVGIPEAHGDLLPEAKVAYVQRLMKEGQRGSHGGRRDQRRAGPQHRDGWHCAGRWGGGISAEAADAVILADDPSRVAEAIRSAAARCGLPGRASGRGWD